MIIAIYGESMVEPFLRCVATKEQKPLVSVLLDYWGTLTTKDRAEVPEELYEVYPTVDDQTILTVAVAHAVAEYEKLGVLWAPQ